MLAIFFGVEFYRTASKKKESCCLLFPSSTKHEIWQLHVVVVQQQQRNVQKSVMHMQSCYFACLNLLLFCHSRCRHCINSLMLRRRSGSTTLHTCVVCSNCTDLVQCGNACNKQQATDEKTTANRQDSAAA